MNFEKIVRRVFMLKTKKTTAFILSFLMLLGILAPIGKVFALDTNELTNVKISRMEVKELDSNTINFTDNTEEKTCILEIDWDASEYEANIKAGDYFNVNLPEGFLATDKEIIVCAQDGTPVANANVRGSNLRGGTLKVVFTSLAEDKADLKGSLAIKGSMVQKDQSPEESITYEMQSEEASEETVEGTEDPNTEEPIEGSEESNPEEASETEKSNEEIEENQDLDNANV